MVLENVISFLKEYAVLLVVGVIVLGLIILNEVKKRKKKNKVKQKTVNEQAVVVNEEPAVVAAPVAPAKLVVEGGEAFDFDSGFEDDVKKKDIVEKLNGMSEDVDEELSEVEDQTLQEYEKVLGELEVVSVKRNKLLVEAKKLKKLYDEYYLKERFLKATKNNIEKIINKKVSEASEEVSPPLEDSSSEDFTNVSSLTKPSIKDLSRKKNDYKDFDEVNSYPIRSRLKLNPGVVNNF